jgi:hypothetical protein
VYFLLSVIDDITGKKEARPNNSDKTMVIEKKIDTRIIFLPVVIFNK